MLDKYKTLTFFLLLTLQIFIVSCSGEKSLLEKANNGDADSQFALGWAYDSGNSDLEQSSMEAVKWYYEAAKQGHMEAQFSLGKMYYQGRGIEQNYSESIKWQKLAAEQGHGNAQFNVGLMYNRGEGVPEDNGEAEKWFLQAAKNKIPDAYFMLGHLNFTPFHTKDIDAAIKWYELAAQQGNEQADIMLELAQKKYMSLQLER